MTPLQEPGSVHRSARHHRAREEFFCRCGLAAGLPLGAMGYQLGGWLVIWIAAIAVFVAAFAMAYWAIYREATRS